MAHQRDLVRLFAGSCACGFLLGLLWGGPPVPPPPPVVPPPGDLAALYAGWLWRQRLTRAPRPPGAPSEAAFLAARVSVLCALQSDEAPRGATAARRTWLRRCSASVEYGRRTPASLTGLAPAGPARLLLLLRRLRRPLAAGGHHWLLLAGDSSFVVLENLRRLVAPLQPRAAHYLGHAAMVGGRPVNLAAAGVLLSAGALARLEHADRHGLFEELDPSLSEEETLGHMMALLSIPPRDTRDGLGRPRFLAMPPSALHQPSALSKFAPVWRDSVYPLTPDRLCCSPEAVSFGRVAWSRIYLLEYMVHHVTADRRTAAGRNQTVVTDHGPLVPVR